MNKDHDKYIYWVGDQRKRQAGDEVSFGDYKWTLSNLDKPPSLDSKYRRLRQPKVPEHLPMQPNALKQTAVEEAFKPNCGERILVSEGKSLTYIERTFTHMNNGRFVCVKFNSEEAYKDCHNISCVHWKYAKPLPAPKLTDAEKLEAIDKALKGYEKSDIIWLEGIIIEIKNIMKG